MDEQLFALLKLGIYVALVPIVFQSLQSIDTTRLFKKNHVGQIQLMYILVTILIAKIVGDFFIALSTIFLEIFNII